MTPMKDKFFVVDCVLKTMLSAKKRKKHTRDENFCLCIIQVTSGGSRNYPDGGGGISKKKSSALKVHHNQYKYIPKAGYLPYEPYESLEVTA